MLWYFWTNVIRHLRECLPAKNPVPVRIPVLHARHHSDQTFHANSQLTVQVWSTLQTLRSMSGPSTVQVRSIRFGPSWTVDRMVWTKLDCGLKIVRITLDHVFNMLKAAQVPPENHTLSSPTPHS
jgi:hypothetical protein